MYLMDKFKGQTPLNYYSRFKTVLAAATPGGYYRNNPTAKISAESNPYQSMKENLEIAEYLTLLRICCHNEEVKLDFIFCMYTGLRFCDVKALRWQDIAWHIKKAATSMMTG